MTVLEPIRPDPRPDRRWIVLVVLLVLAGIAVVAQVGVFGPLLAAAALAWTTNPLVERLERRGWKRGTAIALVCSGIFVVVAGLSALLIGEAVGFVSALDQPDGPLAGGIRGLQDLVAQFLPEDLQARLREWVGSISGSESMQRLGRGLSQVAQSALAVFSTVFSVVGAVVLLPVYFVYLLIDLPVLQQWLRDRIPLRRRDRHERVLTEIGTGISGFLRGFLIIAVLKGTLLAIGLTILGTQSALVVGFLSGLLTIVPLIGAMFGFALAMLLTLAGDASVGAAIAVVAIYGAAEIIEGFVLTPWIQREGAGLHPVTILVSVFFWGAVFGVLGALVAIPLTIVLKALLRGYVLPIVDELAGRRPIA